MIFHSKHEQDRRTIANLKKNIQNLESASRKKKGAIS